MTEAQKKNLKTGDKGPYKIGDEIDFWFSTECGSVKGIVVNYNLISSMSKIVVLYNGFAGAKRMCLVDKSTHVFLSSNLTWKDIFSYQVILRGKTSP